MAERNHPKIGARVRHIPTGITGVYCGIMERSGFYQPSAPTVKIDEEFHRDGYFWLQCVRKELEVLDNHTKPL